MPASFTQYLKSTLFVNVTILHYCLYQHVSVMKRKFQEVTEEHLSQFRRECFAPKTMQATKSAETALLEFFNSQPRSTSTTDYVNINESAMNFLLEKFYVSCRPSKGEDYKATTLQNLRQSLCRALRLSHNFDIVNDPQFKTSNVVFVNRLKELKKTGFGAVDHFPDIAKDDLHKIVSTLSPDNPEELQLLVWFVLQLHFCKRGLENAPLTTKDHYGIVIIEGKRCIVQKRDELTKNHREKDSTRAHGAVLAEQGHTKCPIDLYNKYLSKLDPNSPFLWQLPRNKGNIVNDSNPWYYRKAGKNTIANYMKKISAKCNLSRTYTNHSVRSTSCTLLGESHSDIDIQSISGHRSLSGLSHYKRIDNRAKINMSQTLQHQYLPELASVKEVECPTASNMPATTQDHDHNGCCISYGADNQVDNQVENHVGNQVDNAMTLPCLQEPLASSTDITDINIDDLFVSECEKVNGMPRFKSFFNNCTINNVSINFAQKL